MSLSRKFAFDILGLPTFASLDEIVLRYKTLSLLCFPENHLDYEFALQEFSNITEAAVKLIFFPFKSFPRELTLREMYGFFQYIFFGEKMPKVDEHECDSDDISEVSLSFEDHLHNSQARSVQADDYAIELIQEEAREKAKAEKRRTKKKKRKEKKKLEKLEKETVTKKPESKSSQVEKPDPKLTQDDKSSESEEELDPNSAFVSVIARKHRKVPTIEITETVTRKKRTSLPQEDHQSVVLRSRQLALRGNEMASMGHYSEAVELFSESIGLDPSDHRFYGNRSYCYDRLGQHERALKDAEKSITLSPVWPKGYFRKGRALLGLKKYALAEQFFVEVLKLDNDCEDAISELHKAKLLQIMEKGYSKDHAEAALLRHVSVTEALASLVSTKVSRAPMLNDADIFISDDENEPVLKQMNKQKVAPHLYDIKRDPNNPEGHTSLWVGNVQPDVTEKKLISMFGKFGDLISVKVMPEKFCAFINYRNKSSPGKAMQAYQGTELSGYALVIRFPNSPGETLTLKKKTGTSSQEKVKLHGPVNGNECYYWRTTGCVYGTQCRYQHIKNQKGVDLNKR